MDGYCKLHAKIVMSSIWAEPPHVRLLWITMLAVADADGNVEGSVCGLANLARISVEDCEAGLRRLQQPDPFSSDGTTGERIQALTDGLWHIINHDRYRERQTRRQALDAARKKKARAKKADASARSARAVSVSVSVSAEKKGQQEQLPVLHTPELEDLRREWLQVRKERHRLKTLSLRSWRTIENRARKAGVSIRDVLLQLAEHGWQTWKPEYGQTMAQQRQASSRSHAPQQDRHNPELDLGDPACMCGSCRAYLRDLGQ
jgi:hypothetical protein